MHSTSRPPPLECSAYGLDHQVSKQGPMARMYMWPKRGDREFSKPALTVRNKGTVMRISLPEKLSLSHLGGPFRPYFPTVIYSPPRRQDASA